MSSPSSDPIVSLFNEFGKRLSEQLGNATAKRAKAPLAPADAARQKLKYTHGIDDIYEKDYKGHDGDNPIHWAAFKRDIGVVRLLIKAGLSAEALQMPGKRRLTPLYNTFMDSGRSEEATVTEIVRLLLPHYTIEALAIRNDYNNQTALWKARNNGFTEAAKLIEARIFELTKTL